MTSRVAKVVVVLFFLLLLVPVLLMLSLSDLTDLSVTQLVGWSMHIA